MKYKPLLIPLAGVLLLLVCVGLGLGAALSARGLYEANLDAWQLPARSGLTEDEILLNYHALMDWCSPLNRAELAFPTLPMSADGAQHFAECKVIFSAVSVLGAVGLAGLAGLVWLAVRRRAASILWGAGCVSLGLPLAVLAAMAIDFDRAFVLFHQVFFGNDLWLFDPATDPVIRILPPDYFLLCGVVICAVVVLGSAAAIAAGLTLRKRWSK